MLKLKNLKGESRMETLENYSIVGVIVGALIFSMGVGLTVIVSEGIPVIITMLGAVLSFISSASVVVVLFFREALGKE